MRDFISKLHDSALKLYVTSTTLVSDERGQDLIEYAVLCALVAGTVIALSGTLSNAISGAFTTMGTKVNDAITNA
jgi:Flp pilus assembly pilin Flp